MALEPGVAEEFHGDTADDEQPEHRQPRISAKLLRVAAAALCALRPAHVQRRATASDNDIFKDGIAQWINRVLLKVSPQRYGVIESSLQEIIGETMSFPKIWQLCVNLEKFTSTNAASDPITAERFGGL